MIVQKCVKRALSVMYNEMRPFECLFSRYQNSLNPNLGEIHLQRILNLNQAMQFNPRHQLHPHIDQDRLLAEDMGSNQIRNSWPYKERRISGGEFDME